MGRKESFMLAKLSPQGRNNDPWWSSLVGHEGTGPSVDLRDPRLFSQSFVPKCLKVGRWEEPLTGIQYPL